MPSVLKLAGYDHFAWLAFSASGRLPSCISSYHSYHLLNRRVAHLKLGFRGISPTCGDRTVESLRCEKHGSTHYQQHRRNKQSYLAPKGWITTLIAPTVCPHWLADQCGTDDTSARNGSRREVICQRVVFARATMSCRPMSLLASVEKGSKLTDKPDLLIARRISNRSPPERKRWLPGFQ